MNNNRNGNQIEGIFYQFEYDIVKNSFLNKAKMNISSIIELNGNLVEIIYKTTCPNNQYLNISDICEGILILI